MDFLFFLPLTEKIHGYGFFQTKNSTSKTLLCSLLDAQPLDGTATKAHKEQTAWHVTHTGRTDKITKTKASLVGWRTGMRRVGTLPSWQAEQNTWHSSRTDQSGGRGRCSSCVRPARHHPHQPAKQYSQVVNTQKSETHPHLEHFDQ